MLVDDGKRAREKRCLWARMLYDREDYVGGNKFYSLQDESISKGHVFSMINVDLYRGYGFRFD